MSAVPNQLSFIRASDPQGTAMDVQQRVEPTGISSVGGAASRFVSPSRLPFVGEFASSPQRKTFAVPDVDVSSKTELQLRSSASRASAIEGHRVASQLLAEWHGHVVSIGADNFTASLKGRHGTGVVGSEDEAVIPIADVRDADQDLFRVGAFFSLCISYELNAAGSKRRYTEVVFRRMPAFRREELEAAEERAKDLVRALRVE